MAAITVATLSQSFWDRAERLTRLRREEYQQMREYVLLPFGSHMKFLVEALSTGTLVRFVHQPYLHLPIHSKSRVDPRGHCFPPSHKPADRASQKVAGWGHAAISA